MLGKRILIDKEKCDGCGLCVTACHEGVIELIFGKAEVVRESACDGMGDCLPACPRGAISFSEEPSDSIPVAGSEPQPLCPMANPGYQWPIQLSLVPIRSQFFGDTLIVAADCTAFSVDGFRERFIGSNPVLIGCPKLDDRAGFDKLPEILRQNPVKRIKVIRMEVPCCGALTRILRSAVESSGKDIEISETVLSRSGSVIQ